MTVNSLHIEYLKRVNKICYFEIFADGSVYASLPGCTVVNKSNKVKPPISYYPNMLRVKGRLRDVVTYKNRTGGLFREEVVDPSRSAIAIC